MEIKNNSSRLSGFADRYDNYRPVPPKDLIELAIDFSGKKLTELIVDLGSGTGLSTKPWAGYSKKVIGIDPSGDMVEIAKQNISIENIEYRIGFAENTGLTKNSVDIATCSSSLHWMDPKETVNEVNRILVPSGLFLVYGYYYPVVSKSFKVTEAYEKWRKKIDYLEFEKHSQTTTMWNLNDSLKAFANTGFFRYMRKVYLHSNLWWTSEDYIGFLNAHAGVNYLRKNGLSDTDLGLNEIAGLIKREFGDEMQKILFTYSVHLALKK